MQNQKHTYSELPSDETEKYYDFCLLSGLFEELDLVPQDEISQKITSAEQILSSSKALKGNEKLLLFVESLFLYAEALSLTGKCRISDKKALLSSLCIRHPALELDWNTLLKIVLFHESKKSLIEEQGFLEAAVRIYISSIKEELRNKELELKQQ